MFVTTNYDYWLDQNLADSLFLTDDNSSSVKANRHIRHPFYKRNDISVKNLGIPNAVFHIHGSINDQGSMVLTTVDYLERYSSHRFEVKRNHENPFLTFLETLFRLKNLLFIGYGLNELEILEYIIQKGIETSKSKEEPRHYVLQGFFTHELSLPVV